MRHTRRMKPRAQRTATRYRAVIEKQAPPSLSLSSRNDAGVCTPERLVVVCYQRPLPPLLLHAAPASLQRECFTRRCSCSEREIYLDMFLLRAMRLPLEIRIAACTRNSCTANALLFERARGKKEVLARYFLIARKESACALSLTFPFLERFGALACLRVCVSLVSVYVRVRAAYAHKISKM